MIPLDLFSPLWALVLGGGAGALIWTTASWAIGDCSPKVWPWLPSPVCGRLFWCLAVALASAALARQWTGISTLFGLSALWFAAVHALTDLRSGYIYDCFAWACGLWGLALRLGGGFPALADGLLGALAGGAPLAAASLINHQAMGWGDGCLMAGLGILLGWKMALVALYLGVLIGGVVAVALVLAHRIGRRDSLPLAPALAAGTLAALLWGPQILDHLGTAPYWPWL